jgi:uncharacterized membrane protein
VPVTEQPAEETEFDETERGAAERLTFFSDAVVAIAITLLAIELEVPEGNTASELAAGFAANFGEYLAFMISFLVIARHWVSHHRLFRYVGRATGHVIWLNMAWLFLIVITPFMTRFISEQHVDYPRFVVYTLSQAVQAAVFGALVIMLRRSDGFLPDAPRELVRRGWVPSLNIGIAFLVSIPLFPLIHSWAFAVWAIVPNVLDLVTRRIGGESD